MARLAAQYGAAGVLNSGVGWAVIFGLTAAHLATPAWANACGFAVGLMVSFALHRRIFDGERTAAETIRYIAAVALAFGLNQAALHTALTLFTTAPWAGLIGQAAGVVTYSASLFLLSRLWVFRRAVGSAPVQGRDIPRHLWAVAAAFLIGVAARLSVWTYSTPDTARYLLPWYAFARDHGWRGLGVAFTNYAPVYSYLLIVVTALDRLAPSLLLIKLISFVFEFATAALAYRLIARTTQSSWRASIAFAAAWLAPAVLYNGALWGQADAIWCFFLVASIYLFTTGRNGVLPFAAAFAVKAQGVFLGPFALGMMLKQRRSLLWFAAVPLTYLALAAPVLIAGRPLMSVLKVYADQADTFHALSMHAASLWALAPGVAYGAGVAVGMILAAGAGLFIAWAIARSPRTDAEFHLLAACVSLLAMPFLLPKMHDRYFYAFEIASILLACLNERYAMVAIVAQIDAVLSYIAFDRGIVLGVPIAALQNAVLLGFLVSVLAGRRIERLPAKADLVRYGALVAAIGGLLPFCGAAQSNEIAVKLCAGLTPLLVAQLALLFYRMIRFGDAMPLPASALAVSSS